MSLQEARRASFLDSLSTSFRRAPAKPGSELRGVLMSTLLAEAGELLSAHGATALSTIATGGSDDANSYRHSFSTRVIHRFISHSWRDPVLLKRMALLWESNAGTAFAFGSAAASVSAAATRAGHLPTLVLDYGGGLVNVIGLSSSVYAFCFLVSLAYGHRLARALGLRGMIVFWDKACIRQDDERLKAAGITHIHEFIVASDVCARARDIGQTRGRASRPTRARARAVRAKILRVSHTMRTARARACSGSSSCGARITLNGCGATLSSRAFCGRAASRTSTWCRSPRRGTRSQSCSQSSTCRWRSRCSRRAACRRPYRQHRSMPSLRAASCPAGSSLAMRTRVPSSRG